MYTLSRVVIRCGGETTYSRVKYVMHFRPGASEGSFELLSKQKTDAKFNGPDQISHYFEIIKSTVGNLLLMLFPIYMTLFKAFVKQNYENSTLKVNNNMTSFTHFVAYT
jgi:hypothetical protein